MGNKKPKKKRMHPALKFALIVCSIVFTFIIIAGIGVMAYISNSIVEEVKAPQVYSVGNVTPPKKSIGAKISSTFEKVKENTNFLICGVDDEGGGVRTDTMLIGTFNSKTRNISLISIPRDIMVEMPGDVESELNAVGIYPPNYMKFNEVHAYATKEYGVYALMKQVEHEFGIKLDYYVKVDTAGFREIVDALGGVEMTLTRNYYYYDPDQNLRIDLKAGHQVLNGAAAEGFVRYRQDYANGDLQRIEVQHEFLKELLKQSLQREKVMNNLPALLANIINYTSTDITIAEATKYLKYVPTLSSSNFDTYTLPLAGDGFRDSTGKMFLELDRAGTNELIDQVFFGTGEQVPADSKKLDISVLNGSGVSGLARDTSAMLADKGYTISSIGDFTGTKTSHDRIFVKRSGYGEDLKALFSGSEIVIDKDNVKTGSDITIVLGTDNN